MKEITYLYHNLQTGNIHKYFRNVDHKEITKPHTPTVVTSIPNNFKVYFSKNVAFNRATFREYARSKNLSIVRDVKKANIYVDTINAYKYTKVKKCVIDGEEFFSKMSLMFGKEFPTNETLISDFAEHITEDIPMIDVTCLYDLCNEKKELDYEAYTTIDNALKSTDAPTVLMGLETLVSSVGPEFYIANLWSTHYSTIKANGFMNKISVKTFLEKNGSKFWISGGCKDLNLINDFVEAGIEVIISEKLMTSYVDNIFKQQFSYYPFLPEMHYNLKEHTFVKYEERQSFNREEEQDQGEQLREGDYLDVEGTGNDQDQNIQTSIPVI